MNWFTRFLAWNNRVMAGRYGSDQFSIALLVFYCILLLLSSVLRLGILNILAIAVLFWCLWRMLSRNREKRWKENEWFLSWWNPVWKWMRGISSRFHAEQEFAAMKARDKGTFRYYKCPKCGNKLRVPKGKGKIAITCPVCHNEFIKRT
jgi:ribosomal protein S27E